MSNKITLKSIKKNSKRPGRGIAAGGGKTAGRGTKGQNSRAGHNIPNRFEGGQTPLSMRLPNLPGFKKSSKKTVIITLDMLSKYFQDGEVVSFKSLQDKKLIKPDQKVKILSNGKLSKKISIKDVKISKNAFKMFDKVEVATKK